MRHIGPANTPTTPVVVEYDCRGQRVTKSFASPHAARRFYVLKHKQGKHPQVKKGT